MPKRQAAKPLKSLKEKKPKEKKPKKPLFSFKKKAQGPEAASLPETAAAQSNTKGVPPAEGAATAPAAGDPTSGEGKQQRKSIFGKIRSKTSKKAKPKEPKASKKKRSPGSSIFGSTTSPVGLDLGSSSISAVRLRHQTAGSALLQAALDSLPEGLIQEGEVKDVEGLAFAIKEFWKTYKIRGRKVTLGLANQKIVVRTLDFPPLDEKELRSAIEFQAQDYIPIPIDEAVFDFHVLGRFTDVDGLEKQKILVVAAQKDMVMDFINAIKKAKLQVAGVDLQAFALLRSQVPKSFLDEGAPAGTAIAVANIASDVTNLVVDVAGEPQFTRIISFGGDDFTKAVQEQMGITFSEAEVMKAQIGLPVPGTQEEKAPDTAEGEITPPEPGTGIIPPGEASPESSEGGTAAGDAAPGEEGGTTEPATGPKETNSTGGSEGPGSGGPEGLVPGAGSPFGPNGLTPKEEEGQPRPQGGSHPEAAWPGGGAQAGGPPPDEGAGDLWPEGPPEPTEGEKEEVVHKALEVTADALGDEIRRSLDYYMSQEQSVPVGKLLLSGGGAMLPNLDGYLRQIFPFPVEMGNPLLRITRNKSSLSNEELKVLAPRLAIAIGLALEDED